MASRQKVRKVPRQSLSDVTNGLPDDLQTRVGVFRKMLHDRDSIYHQHLARTALTTSDVKSIRYLIEAFDGVLDSIDALNWTDERLKKSGVQVIYNAFSEGAAQLEKLWALSNANKLPQDIILYILSFLTLDPYDVLEPRGAGPFAVAQVNKAWAAAALKSPRLWSRLIITNQPLASHLKPLTKKCVQRVKYALERSHTEPLEIRLSFPSFKDSDREAVWARQIVVALIGQAKRWVKAKMSLMPMHMVELCVLKADDVGMLRDLLLTLRIVPGDVELRLDGLRALKEALPRLRKLNFKGFESLSSLNEGQIVDNTVDAIVVKEGANLTPFNLPNLRHVHLLRKDPPVRQAVSYRKNTDPSESESEIQLSSVGALVERLSCTVTSISLTNPVLSTTLLADLNTKFPALRTLRIKMDGAYDNRRFIKVLTHLRKAEWLPSLRTLSLWVQGGDEYREKFFTEAFVEALKKRSEKGGKFRKLRLFPDASELMGQDALKKVEEAKSLRVERLREFS